MEQSMYKSIEAHAGERKPTWDAAKGKGRLEHWDVGKINFLFPEIPNTFGVK